MTNPHKSTTARERFFHVPLRGADPKIQAVTVFLREHDTIPLRWTGSVAMCSVHDQFCRRTGRNVARRRYFNAVQKHDPVLIVDFEEDSGMTVPNFEVAESLVNYVLTGNAAS